MKIVKTLLLSAVMLAGGYVQSVNADDYGVQVGAFEVIDPAFIDKLVGYGEIIELSNDGLTRVIVKAGNSRADNEYLLKTLQDAGFGDAFIRSLGATSEVNASYKRGRKVNPSDHDINSSGEHLHNGQSHRHIEEDAAWLRLSPEERRNAVYLDGKLHLKQGDEFIPLD